MRQPAILFTSILLASCAHPEPVAYRLSPTPVEQPAIAPPPPKPHVVTKTRTVTKTIRQCPDIEPWPLTRGEAGAVNDGLRDWIVSVNRFLEGDCP